MTITASLVKELRERTGAGMMECKKALVETNGDSEAAAELLRTKGQASADKKAGRIAAEGSIDELRQLVPAASLAEVECVDEQTAVSRAEGLGWLVRRYRDRLTFLMSDRRELTAVVNAFEGIDVSSVALREVNLEHAYLEVMSGARAPSAVATSA